MKMTMASLSYRIAMKPLLDEGLPLSAAALLRDVGIVTIYVDDIGMSKAEVFIGRVSEAKLLLFKRLMRYVSTNVSY